VTGSDFERDTAVRRDGDGWTADLQPRWNVGNNPNGGYLLAIAVRAMQGGGGPADPVTVTAHYLSPPADGPVTIRTQVVKPGRTFVTVMAEVLQGERERVRVLGAFGDLSERQGPTRVSARPPDIPPPDECVSLAHLTRQAGRARSRRS
jgi:acyl-CoA thioesterase